MDWLHDYDARPCPSRRRRRCQVELRRLFAIAALRVQTSWSWLIGQVCGHVIAELTGTVSGMIAKALAEHSYELQQSKADDLAEPESAPSSNPEMDAMTDHLFLPEKEELEKLLRYEAMINRQLNHSIAELERVQARRKGEANPADI